ncbi:MAG: DUF4178 domain-containing protein [Planctomycetota bacterium]|nr:MAG: DUF4178 domain-containing protein [Planctomycetota bacterium]
MAGKADVVVPATEIRCENCGAPFTLRGFQNTRTAACEHCGSVFDTRSERWELVQRVEGAYQAKPTWSLGTRGTLDGIEWEVIGWMRRSVVSWGTTYTWEEHLLFNPYHGFRYLMVQDRHFVVVQQVPGLPQAGARRATYRGRTYRHFSTTDQAVVEEVLGEFPWEVRRGDVAKAMDYVDPPYILSCERSAGETVWSEGRYLPRDEAFAAFGSPTRPLRPPVVVHPCQPNPHKALASWSLKAGLVGLALWAFLSLLYLGNRQRQVVWSGTVGAARLAEFRLDSSTSPGTLEVQAASGVDNSWVYYDAMLVDKSSEKASYLGLEVSYYHGYSDGESWSEGSQETSEVLSNVPNGDYALQLTRHPSSLYKGNTRITVLRDVPLYRYPLFALLLTSIVPAFVLWRARAFEHRRWQQSDYASD